MIDYTRTLFAVTSATPRAYVPVGTTGVIVWTEVTPAVVPTDPPIYGNTYADDLVVPGVSQFDRASRIVDQIISGEIPGPMVALAIDVVTSLVTASPVYAVHYDGTTFTEVVAPPAGFVESHNWAGWPSYPIT